MRLTPTLQKKYLLTVTHSKTREQPTPFMLGYDVYVPCVHHVIATYSCLVLFFSQLAQRFRATVSRFDYSQHYQDRDGRFSNKDSGPACLFSPICCFPKVSKQYSKCFTAANQDLRLSKLLLGSVKQDTLPFWHCPISEDTGNEVMPT